MDTLQRIKKVARDHKPSSTFELVEAEMEVADHSGTGKLPHSRRQVSDVCKKLFSTGDTDDLAVIMERCKCTETGQSPFAVQAAPQPLYVLSTNLQLKQVQLCCTDPECFSILSVDPTFNLGSFFVMPLVFLHKAFVSKHTGKQWRSQTRAY